ncbi:MAG: hypothetical protein HDS11_02760 [Bacteroides sp.]|nr:hypothetical protein [Bacteroides sp.]
MKIVKMKRTPTLFKSLSALSGCFFSKLDCNARPSIVSIKRKKKELSNTLLTDKNKILIMAINRNEESPNLFK